MPRAGHAQERDLQNKRVAHAGCAPRERRASYVTLRAHTHTCRGAQTVWSVRHARGVRDFADRRGVARARGLRACPLPGPPHVWGSPPHSAAWPALRRPSCLLSRWQERTVTPTWARASLPTVRPHRLSCSAGDTGSAALPASGAAGSPPRPPPPPCTPRTVLGTVLGTVLAPPGLGTASVANPLCSGGG